MKKIKFWLRRYAPAEFFAIIGVVLFAGILYIYTKNRIIAAYAGVIGENIAYYGYISIHDLKKNKIKYEKSGQKFGIVGYLITIRNLIFEFSLAEVLDSLFIRPLCLFWFPLWVKNYSVGIIAGKIAADIIFYIPTILVYEIRNKYVKD